MLTSLRVLKKLICFIFLVAKLCLMYFFFVLPKPHADQKLARAMWLQRGARSALKLLNCKLHITGTIPQQGLLIANHLSYLDILVIAATTPAIFVSKAEVNQWPLFGLLARFAGTLYIQRHTKRHVAKVNNHISEHLLNNLLVVIFPEGTTSNGETILPFHPSLLQPAIHHNQTISIAYINYHLPDGDVKEDVYFWGNHTLLAHIPRLARHRSVGATLRLDTFFYTTQNRKELAKALHSAMLHLKNNPI